ncbi:MAG: type II secretion system protein [bacterium]
MKEKQKGFTLIEMLIVIAVITILAGVVFRGIQGVRESARDTRRIGDLTNVQSILEMYMNQCNHYPGVADSVTNCNHPNITTWNDLVAALSTVSSKVPRDPVPSKTYYYGVDSVDGLQYVIGAALERENASLKDDVDTPSFTPTPNVDCADSSFRYCVES